MEGNPVGIKEALSYLGICAPDVRLPLVTMSESNRKKLPDAMDALKNLK